ncbi:MAG: hypothetical protein HYZ40_07055 [Rhodospirillales bacterium]|nr:hypothetical protein [Rhodospirillales bacterium]
MKRFLPALALIALAGSASAQTKPNPGATLGAADTKVRLQTLGYKNVHDLRPGLMPGEWQGRARQGNVDKSVTVSPKGSVVAR